jgi:single-strand DNA-binding protein
MVTGRLRQRSWETPEGDKRSVTELEADEVAASLKWATATVERAASRGNGAVLAAHDLEPCCPLASTA